MALLAGWHVLREPANFAFHPVADVLRVSKSMAFVGVDDELGFDAEIA